MKAQPSRKALRRLLRQRILQHELGARSRHDESKPDIRASQKMCDRLGTGALATNAGSGLARMADCSVRVSHRVIGKQSYERNQRKQERAKYALDSMFPLCAQQIKQSATL